MQELLPSLEMLLILFGTCTLPLEPTVVETLAKRTQQPSPPLLKVKNSDEWRTGAFWEPPELGGHLILSLFRTTLLPLLLETRPPSLLLSNDHSFDSLSPDTVTFVFAQQLHYHKKILALPRMH